MSLNFGRDLLAIPGPSIIPDRVLAAMHKPSPNIYGGPLIDLTISLYPDLKTVARTSGEVAIYISNGHGVWEAALRNTVNPEEKVLVLATGFFAERWGGVGKSFGIDVEIIDFGARRDAAPQQLEDRLRQDKAGQIKAVLVVQADTASSVKNDIPALREAIDRAGHDAMFMVDCIASLACDQFEMDKWGADVMVAGCQKGLMTPAGLAFVFFNDKAKEARKHTNPGMYWDWVSRTEPEVYYQRFCGTAPTHHLFGLREALDILVHEEGVEAAWQRHERLAAAVWAALDRWSSAGNLEPNIAAPSNRTVAVTTVNTKKGDAGRIRDWCEHQAGLTLGIALGFPLEEANDHFRIGHMGHLNPPMLLGALGTIDAALKALGIDHGEGAVEAASSVVAGHKSI